MSNAQEAGKNFLIDARGMDRGKTDAQQCSGESPCSTCRNVESARLWKQPCLRTRIADELEIYSANLQTVLAYQEVNLVRSRMKFETFLGHIEATHFPDSEIYVSFNALEGRKQFSEIDEAMNAHGPVK